MNVYVIIPAAGTGKRFGSSSPKQFIKLAGIPVIMHSILAFEKIKHVTRIVIACDEEYFDKIQQYAGKFNIKKIIDLVKGGKTRFDSVKNAFNSLNCKDDDIIIIHDAARPNINIKFIENIINECDKSDNVIYGIKVPDTIKSVRSDYVTETIDRKALRMIQTPQAFKYKILKKAYSKIRTKEEITDESMLLEKAGYKVKVIEGSKDNIKITTSSDIKFLKHILDNK